MCRNRCAYELYVKEVRTGIGDRENGMGELVVVERGQGSAWNGWEREKQLHWVWKEIGGTFVVERGRDREDKRK